LSVEKSVLNTGRSEAPEEGEVIKGKKKKQAKGQERGEGGIKLQKCSNRGTAKKSQNN